VGAAPKGLKLPASQPADHQNVGLPFGLQFLKSRGSRNYFISSATIFWGASVRRRFCCGRADSGVISLSADIRNNFRSESGPLHPLPDSDITSRIQKRQSS